MANSDNTYGLHNKATREFRIWYDSGENRSDIVPQSFGGNVETAKNFFFTTEALAVFDETSTQIQYAITADGNGLKITNAHGTKGAPDQAEADDWSAQFTSRKNALIGSNGWIKSTALTVLNDPDSNKHQVGKGWVETQTNDHLF